jgi:hypothetical protein
VVAVCCLLPVTAFAADLLEGSCTGAAASSPICNDPSRNSTTNPLSGDDGILVQAARIISAFIGAIAVIIIIVSGIKMTTSQGDATAVKNARNAIIYAAVGLVIAAISQLIIRLVVVRI